MVKLLVCGHFVREARAAIAMLGLQDVIVEPYSPDCGHPQRPEHLHALLARLAGQDDDTILLAGGCLPADYRDLTVLEPNVTIHREDNCMGLLVDAWKLDELFSGGAYVLTPGWMSGWRGQLERWGFDRETARAFFAESAQSLALLDTGVDDRSASTLLEFSEYLARPGNAIAVGLDHFSLVLGDLVLKSRLAAVSRDLKARTELVAWMKSDQAMVLDLMANLIHMDSEAQTIDQVFYLFDMLFAPRRIVYASVRGGRVTECFARPDPAPDLESSQSLTRSSGDLAPDPDGRIRLRIEHKGDLLGILELDTVAYPEYRNQYLGLVPSLIRICALGIANARMYQDIEQLAITDPLTGLLNRRHFFKLGTAEFSRALRYGRPLAVLMLDIDLFKLVNDTYGHPAGDEVLMAFSSRLAEELRASDICGRYGGEEFIVMLPESGGDIAVAAAERIRLSIQALVIPCDGVDLNVTVSIGISILEPGCADLEALIGRSDQALYEAKQTGRNRVCVFTEK